MELAISTRAQGDVQTLLELVGVESPFHGRDAQPLGDCVAVGVGSPQGGMTGHVRFVRYRARLADSHHSSRPSCIGTMPIPARACRGRFSGTDTLPGA